MSTAAHPESRSQERSAIKLKNQSQYFQIRCAIGHSNRWRLIETLPLMIDEYARRLIGLSDALRDICEMNMGLALLSLGSNVAYALLHDRRKFTGKPRSRCRLDVASRSFEGHAHENSLDRLRAILSGGECVSLRGLGHRTGAPRTSVALPKKMTHEFVFLGCGTSSGTAGRCGYRAGCRS